MNTPAKPTLVTAEQQPPKMPTIEAGKRVQAIVPTSFEDAWRIANVAVKSGMAPKDIDTPEKAMVCIMHGMEVGLPPMASLQSIAVINGRPTIWGDAAIGLVKSSGLCEYINEWEEPRDGNPTAICATKRKGEDKPVTRTFSLNDQVTANLANKPIHKQYPTRMRQMRARAFCLRDTYADVLKGLHIREEVMDYDTTTPNAVPPVPLPPPSDTVAPQRATVAAGAADVVIWEDTAADLESVLAPPPIPPVPTAKEVVPIEPTQHGSTLNTQSRKEVMPSEPTNPEPVATRPVTDMPDIPPEIDRRPKPAQPTPPPPAVEPPHTPEPPKPVDWTNTRLLPDDQWLRDLDGAFGGCEDLASFGEQQAKIMAPQHGKVSKEAWSKAVATMNQHMVRITEALTKG